MGEADDYTYYKLFQRIENNYFPPTIVKYCCQYKNGFEIEKFALDAYYSSLYGPSNKLNSITASISQNGIDIIQGEADFKRSNSIGMPQQGLWVVLYLKMSGIVFYMHFLQMHSSNTKQLCPYHTTEMSLIRQLGDVVRNRKHFKHPINKFVM